jgi:hypothetical protein
MLPLNFKNPADYDKVKPDDKVDIIGVKELAEGSPITLRLHHKEFVLFTFLLEKRILTFLSLLAAPPRTSPSPTPSTLVRSPGTVPVPLLTSAFSLPLSPLSPSILTLLSSFQDEADRCPEGFGMSGDGRCCRCCSSSFRWRRLSFGRAYFPFSSLLYPSYSFLVSETKLYYLPPFLVLRLRREQSRETCAFAGSTSAPLPRFLLFSTPHLDARWRSFL